MNKWAEKVKKEFEINNVVEDRSNEIVFKRGFHPLKKKLFPLNVLSLVLSLMLVISISVTIVLSSKNHRGDNKEKTNNYLFYMYIMKNSTSFETGKYETLKAENVEINFYKAEKNGIDYLFYFAVGNICNFKFEVVNSEVHEIVIDYNNFFGKIEIDFNQPIEYKIK